MALVGSIQHNELPDNLLHEPKGASTAASGTVYIANGAGSGSFGKLPVSSLDIAPSSVEDLQHIDIDNNVTLSGATLSQTADGTLTDVQAYVGIPQELTSKVNKNAAELVRLYNSQAAINEQIKQNISNIEIKINEILTALKEVGVVHE